MNKVINKNIDFNYLKNKVNNNRYLLNNYI